MSETRFTKDHEWVRLDGSLATIGITTHAQEALGDIVFVELPEEGRQVESGEACAVVESVKAASDVYAPLPGTITARNMAISDDPALVNRAPEGDGWFYQMRVENLSGFEVLMDAAEYKQMLDSL